MIDDEQQTIDGAVTDQTQAREEVEDVKKQIKAVKQYISALKKGPTGRPTRAAAGAGAAAAEAEGLDIPDTKEGRDEKIDEQKAKLKELKEELIENEQQLQVYIDRVQKGNAAKMDGVCAPG